MPYPPLPGNYFPTESPWQNLVVTTADSNIAGITFGFTLGFAYFVALKAIHETRRVKKMSIYITLLWAEFFANILVAIMVYLLMQGVAPPSFLYFFFLLVLWSIELHCLIQIIANRVCILMDSNKQRNALRWGMFAAVAFINVSVFCIWIPAKLQISQKYIKLNNVWDRIEKVLYFVVDAGLNWFFIYKVKSKLIEFGGLKKYSRLVRYNTQMIFVSLSMDIMIIGMMSYPNELVYALFHPVAYLVKLNIEMAMSNLIIKVARDAGIAISEDSTTHVQSSGVRGASSMQVSVQVTRTQHQEDIELAQQERGVWRPQKGPAAVVYPISSAKSDDQESDKKAELD